MSRPRFAIARIAIVVPALLLGACAIGPDYHRPEPQVAAEFAGTSLVAATATAPQGQWWKQFNDPLLDELVDKSLEANRDIAAASARLRAARSARREAGWEYLPTPMVEASGTRVRQSRGGAVGPFEPVREYDLYDAGFDASWELDLFGGVRREHQAARADHGAAFASLEDVRLAVVAELARNYFELRGAQQQLAVAVRNADYQRQALDLVQSRLDAGRGNALDTARAEGQVETTLASVPPLEAAVDRARRRIEVLAGQQPGTLGDRLGVVTPAPALPMVINVDDPAAMLRRRPDVRVAERRLAATSARIGVATADLFPRISLNGAIGFSAQSLGALDDTGNDYSRIGPSLSWAILGLGKVKERIRAAGARHEEAFASYEQSVLLALEDVENSLSGYGRERRRQEHLAAAARANVLAADLATQRFEGGVSDFLTALDAYRAALEAEDRLAASQTAAATALIALYKALGAGAPQSNR